MLSKLLGKNNQTAVSVRSPLTGEVVPLDRVPDEAFAGRHMGAGIAIEPSHGKLAAPFDGTVRHLIHTKHALLLEHPSGLQLLIHLGINTVALNGHCFTSRIQTGDSFKQGETLIEFDPAAIASAGFPTICPIVVVNEDELRKLAIETNGGCVTAGDDIILTAVLNG
ncbi:PTS glucose transporter subunit IIA [Paenibacillus sp. NPDC058071]|uniref:PTS sugar transporter subunit IIA n=1 Tax=Paenibacillus sp. NPDC058071 TaxID=3346326 RepID=UPI0036DEB9E8